MVNKCLKTALLGCLALILAQCSPAKDTNAPVFSITPKTGDMPRLETQAAPVTPDQSHSMNDVQTQAASAAQDQLNSIKDAQTPSTASPPTDLGLQSLIDRAIDDLSARLDTNIKNIETLDAQQVEWPDASLGCPQPDMAYLTVITPGYWILLEVDGEIYPYHTDEREQVVLCLGNPSDPDSPLPLIPIAPGGIKDGEPWMPVD